MKKRIGKRFPFLYQLRVKQLMFKRHIINLNPGHTFAYLKSDQILPYTVKKHKSILRRVLGHTDPILQENKIVNLRIALKHVNGIVIQPGETFSFWKLIGVTSKEKGYIEGLMLSHGEVKVGTGGGLCQLANMLYWLALHTPLVIKERHHHSFDLFPDDRRVIPFGTGTSVFYNYVDLQFYNPTENRFQFNLEVTDEYLEGTISSEAELAYDYKVKEKNHQFYQRGDKWYRGNEIWRQTYHKSDDTMLDEVLVNVNHSEVKYMNSHTPQETV
ncbi:vancomycin resistance protein [Paenibacillus pectinilyticus]|uniref:Vancomycin resistance protein n=1 Tax=Paenibacillus pectinilyticus TaxID=512399 RepID=A0A1C1A1X4_9BACL|nr:VanW family protein [Paenibacillus pectinilyticus]OCT14526.1 vancomycin resistance protein [Paenibacillus pectinilyticus]